ncbi:amidohydrolase family protein [Arthrobacter sp. StoSoilB5]|jgi:imidazolonepropionase-like amidohydrolase|uniref:amidohydrolase family protein n=1 Tax=Arthrobacter sp. StoSoilB5 TaxID=2830992 RepID=UPI001CC4CBE9|nr:amidohydrolase family protein [Arthrobacter sp. StoSoilB5]BCW46702.1 amidohydrolase [Arthrobacter sp. StoSoilB5]
MTITFDVRDRPLPYSVSRAARTGDDVTVLLNARVVDPESGTSGSLSDVWLQAGQISRITHAGSEPGMGSVLDLKGSFVVPGLMDAHVHLAFDGGDDPKGTYQSSSDDEIIAQVVANARIALRAGTTTVRDCGTPRHLLAPMRAALGMVSDVATVVHCGAPICRVGGHGHDMGGEVRTRHDIETIIAEQHAAGATWIKLMASGGGLTPGTSPSVFEFDPTLLREAVVIAGSYGMRTAAHAHASSSMAACIEAGVHSLEHASMLGPDEQCVPDRELLRRAADAGIPVVPTVISADIVSRQLREGHQVLSNPKDRNVVARLESRFSNVTEFLHSGVSIVAGTDAGPAHVTFDLIARELERYVDAGLAAQHALKSATCEAADMLGVEKEAGRIRPGLWADLIVTEADPLQDITTLAMPVGVLKRGRLIAQ